MNKFFCLNKIEIYQEMYFGGLFKHICLNNPPKYISWYISILFKQKNLFIHHLFCSTRNVLNRNKRIQPKFLIAFVPCLLSRFQTYRNNDFHKKKNEINVVISSVSMKITVSECLETRNSVHYCDVCRRLQTSCYDFRKKNMIPKCSVETTLGYKN